MVAQRPVGNFPKLAFMVRLKRPVGRLQQLRLQFRAVLLQIQSARGERHLMIPVREHNRLAVACLGKQSAKLTLGFQDGNRFHIATLTLPAEDGKAPIKY